VDIEDDALALTAVRPEPFRYRRLADVLERVEQDVRESNQLESWFGALRRLDDAKGDLTAYWRSEDDRARFAAFVDRAWASVGEDGDDVGHEVLTA